MSRTAATASTERLGDWSDAELSGFADQLAAYNSALTDD